MPFWEIFLVLLGFLQKYEVDSPQCLCAFSDIESGNPHRYWDWAGWNLGQYYVVEYDQRSQNADFRVSPRRCRKKRVIYVDGKTYRKMKRDFNNRPYSIEEMFLYDMLFDDVKEAAI